MRLSAISLLRTDPRIQVREAAEKEWELFSEERSAEIEEVSQLRQRVAEEEARRKNDKEPQQDEVEMAHDDDAPPSAVTDAAGSQTKGAEMDVDDAPTAPSSKEQSKSAPPEGEKKDEPAAMPADDDDAVEY